VALFMHRNNDFYVATTSMDQILRWRSGNPTAMRIPIPDQSSPTSVSVSFDNSLYLATNTSIFRWKTNITNGTQVMIPSSPCTGLFVDSYDTLYCSMAADHRVISKSLSRVWQGIQDRAGTGIAGNTSTTLHNPWGIFVDLNLDLYVADCGNNRIQRFAKDSSTGMTVAGMGASVSNSIDLQCPKSVFVDSLGFLFIADYGNNRILRLGATGFRCCADRNDR
jgi:DNA-binding beta-propeller fold protein YncE